MKRTGIVYDELMTLHEDKNKHPECPKRIIQIYNELNKLGLAQQCVKIPARCVLDDELLLVHHLEYIKTLKDIPHKTIQQLEQMSNEYNSVYLNTHSLTAAKLSAGSVVEVCNRVLSGDIQNGVAIVRPPGHHAEADCAMGFCLYNNVAIAAACALKSVERVAIVDWDAHHGNGTQHIFYDNPQVMYISLHRYDNANFYPGSEHAGPEYTGNGKNVNIAWNPLNDEEIGDHAYMYAFETCIKPMLKEFNPELIIVSAGFDCAYGDPLGGLYVSPNGFAYMTSQLMNQSKVVLALEGGYNTKVISKCMSSCVEVLLSKEIIQSAPKLNISQSVKESVKQTLDAHQSYWKFLKK